MKTPPTSIQHFYAHAYQIVLHTVSPGKFHDDPLERNAAFRGAFQAAMSKLFCSQSRSKPGKPCTGCQCLYSDFTGQVKAPETWQKGRMENVSPPTIFRSPLTSSQYKSPTKATVCFEMIVIGKANQHFPYIISALLEMCRSCLKDSNGYYRLERVVETKPNGELGQVLFEKGYPCQNQLKFPIALDAFLPVGKHEWLSLNISPMVQLKANGQIQEQPDIVLFVHRLLRRMALLSAAYCDGAADNLEEYARHLSEDLVILEDRTQNASWNKRESERFLKQNAKRKRHDHKGWRGELIIQSPNGSSLVPFLQLGQWIGLGKLCGMGMGQYFLSFETGIVAEASKHEVNHF